MRFIFDEQSIAITAMNARYEKEFESVRFISEETRKKISEIAELLEEYRQSDNEKKRQLSILALYYASKIDGLSISTNEDSIEELGAQLETLSANFDYNYEGKEYLLKPWVIPIRAVIEPTSGIDIDFIDMADITKSKEDVPSTPQEIEYIFPDDKPRTDEQIRESVKHKYNGKLKDASAYAALLMA